MKMKNLIFCCILLCYCAQSTLAQNHSNTVRLNPAVEVVNTIFWNNFNYRATSSGVMVKHSALDLLTPGTDNIRLFSTPFVDGQSRINFTSPVYNAGRNSYLRPVDTFDLDYNPRINCNQVDIGAYEFPTVTTKITEEPQNLRLCEGSSAELSVTAEGDGLTYQWQRNGVNLPGQTRSTLTFEGNRSDTGQYRVIAFGACCNDTSIYARVDVDPNPASGFIVMNDTTIVSGESVALNVISSNGTVTWYEHDLQTEVSDLLIQNITETRQYVAIAQNGVCANEAMAEVWIYVDGTDCNIKTLSDTSLCENEPYRLLLADASVNYTWYNLNTNEEVPHFTVVRPDTTTRFAAVGQNSLGGRCSDTLTVYVHEVAFQVMNDIAACAQNGGVDIHLWSNPMAHWYYENDEYIGYGNRDLYILNNTATSIYAKYDDGMCEISRAVSVYSNPPLLEAYPLDTILCVGDSVQLSTNINPAFIHWKQILNPNVAPGTGPDVPFDPTTAGPVVAPDPGVHLYEAWSYDALCGDIYKVVSVTVRDNPQFEITTPTAVCENSSLMLTASPNATYWTLLDETRVSNPITANIGNTYVGWYSDGVCMVSDTITTTIEPKPSFAVCSDTAVTPGSLVALWSTPEATEWFYLADQTLLGNGDQTVSPEQTTVYEAQYYSDVCGVLRDTVNVHVSPKQIHIDQNNVSVIFEAGCTDSTGYAAVIVDSATTYPFSFLWNDGSTDSVRTGLTPGTYTVTITDKLGSTVIKSFTLSPNPPMTISYSVVKPDNEYCEGGQIKTTVSGGTPPYDYLWSDDPHGAINNPDRYHMDAGVYALVVTDSKGCSQSFAVALQCLYNRVMPTLYISPNHDQKNDYLKIQYIERYPNNRVILFNSYGEEVRVLKNYNNSSVIWDGKNDKGQVLPDGVYYYILEAEGLDPMPGWVLMKASKSK